MTDERKQILTAARDYTLSRRSENFLQTMRSIVEVAIARGDGVLVDQETWVAFLETLAEPEKTRVTYELWKIARGTNGSPVDWDTYEWMEGVA